MKKLASGVLAVALTTGAAVTVPATIPSAVAQQEAVASKEQAEKQIEQKIASLKSVADLLEADSLDVPEGLKEKAGQLKESLENAVLDLWEEKDNLGEGDTEELAAALKRAEAAEKVGKDAIATFLTQAVKEHTAEVEAQTEAAKEAALVAQIKLKAAGLGLPAAEETESSEAGAPAKEEEKKSEPLKIVPFPIFKPQPAPEAGGNSTDEAAAPAAAESTEASVPTPEGEKKSEPLKIVPFPIFKPQPAPEAGGNSTQEANDQLEENRRLLEGLRKPLTPKPAEPPTTPAEPTPTVETQKELEKLQAAVTEAQNELAKKTEELDAVIAKAKASEAARDKALAEAEATLKRLKDAEVSNIEATKAHEAEITKLNKVIVALNEQVKAGKTVDTVAAAAPVVKAPASSTPALVFHIQARLDAKAPSLVNTQQKARELAATNPSTPENSSRGFFGDLLAFIAGIGKSILNFLGLGRISN